MSNELWRILVMGGYLLVAAAIVSVVMDNRQPAKTMAWVLVLSFLPVVGIIFYIIFGVNWRRERAISRRSISELTKGNLIAFEEQQDLHIPSRYKGIVNLFKNNESMPFKNNQIDFFLDGYQFFPALLREIAAAKDHIHIEFFIFENDALGRLLSDALIQKAREGVEVRLIYDDVGCWRVRRNFFSRMMEAGVQVMPFLPVRIPSLTSKVNCRNHRKVVVIDGSVGFIGGFNVAMRYVKGLKHLAWRDTMIRVEGGVVCAMQGTFLIDWCFVSGEVINDAKYYPAPSETIQNNCIGQIVISGPFSPYPEIMEGYVNILTTARHYVYLESPYFMPTEPVLFAMKTAARSGVDVRLIVPLKGDSRFVAWASRSFLREIDKAGVKVYFYNQGFIHSKLMVSDNSFCTFGSTNVDFRSFENNFESNLFFYDEGLALRARSIFMRDLDASLPLADVGYMQRQNVFIHLWESATRLVSPVL